MKATNQCGRRGETSGEGASGVAVAGADELHEQPWEGTTDPTALLSLGEPRGLPLIGIATRHALTQPPAISSSESSVAKSTLRSVPSAYLLTLSSFHSRPCRACRCQYVVIVNLADRPASRRVQPPPTLGLVCLRLFVCSLSLTLTPLLGYIHTPGNIRYYSRPLSPLLRQPLQAGVT